MIAPALAQDIVVAIGGKTSLRTGSNAQTGMRPLHVVAPFAAGMGVALGHTPTAKKSNEITAIPELLSKLALEDCVVTIDAMCTQTKIARKICEHGAHYVLCVKDNHPKLLDSIMFAGLDPRGALTPSAGRESTDADHRRTEIRLCRAFDANDRLD